MSGWKLIGETLVSPAQTGLGEYDGDILTFTPNGLERGIVPCEMFYRLNAGLAGANSTAAQSIFGVGATLTSGVIYELEMQFSFQKTAGTTSHTISMLFGGTAIVGGIIWQCHWFGENTSFPATASVTGTANNSTTSVVITGAIANAVRRDMFRVTGTFAVTTGGTFIPQYQLSAAPGGAYSTNANSYIKIKPIGLAGSNTSVGTWA